MTATVVLYGRPGCHLCEDALAIIERVSTHAVFVFEQVDIESDDALLSRYLERIPVITVNGRETFELFVDERELESAVAGS
jgi:glutaredoxin